MEKLKIFALALLIVLPIRYFVIQPFIVRGESMDPNFQDGEYLVVDELSYEVRAPQRGEAIVFHYPKDTQEYFIKRIIGLPGETVQIANGGVKIFNSIFPKGFTLNETYLPVGLKTIPNMTIKLNGKQYFVMGDNRDYSSDSRFWGPVDRGLIVGRVAVGLWPANRFGFISDPLATNVRN